jgi:radical SAM protein with 4Fe4S-binding SPASM domain
MGERLDHERYMDKSLVEEILRALRILHGQYKVYLLGGEPTTHPQFCEILDICKEQEYRVVVTSNGLIAERRWRELTRDRIDSFSFSMDGGRKETHEFMRGVNTFAPLMENVRRAVTLGFQTRLIYTVTTRNIDDVPILLDMADELGVEMISFHYFTPTGFGQTSPELQISPSRWIEFCETLKVESNRRRLQLYYPPAFVRDTELPNLIEQGYRGCTARNLERLAIFPDRRVYICSAFFDTDHHYGTFQDGRVVPRSEPQVISELVLVNTLSSNCSSCPNGTACRGGCPAYDYYDRTLASNACDRKVVPICPLWSMSANPQTSVGRFTELR